MSAEMRTPLDERRALIENRADALLDQAVAGNEEWVNALGSPPKDARKAAEWRLHARTVVAYRDRYKITAPSPLGAPAKNTAQKIDAARATTALNKTRELPTEELRQEQRPAAPAHSGPSL